MMVRKPNIALSHFVPLAVSPVEDHLMIGLYEDVHGTTTMNNSCLGPYCVDP